MIDGDDDEDLPDDARDRPETPDAWITIFHIDMLGPSCHVAAVRCRATTPGAPWSLRLHALSPQSRIDFHND